MKKIQALSKTVLLSSSLALAISANAITLTNSKHTLGTKGTVVGLGAAMISNSSLPLSAICFKNVKPTLASFNSHINMSRSVNTSEVAKTLNLDINAEGGWSMFSASAGLDYVKAIKNTSKSLNFSYLSTINAKVYYDEKELHGLDAFDNAAAEAYNESVDRFMARCGDSYIRTIDLGAVLNVSLSLEFRNQQQKKLFESKVKAGLGDLFKASSKIKNLIEKHHLGGSLTLRAYQAGGDPSYLGGILGGGKDVPIIECSLQNLTACNKAIKNIIDYARAKGKWKQHGFANQVRRVNDKIIATSLEPLSLKEAEHADYESNFGLPINIVEPSESVIKARVKLNEMYKRVEMKTMQARDIVHSAAFKFIKVNKQDKMKIALDHLEKNLNAFSNGEAMKCFLPSTQNNCAKIVNKIAAHQLPVDFKYIQLLRGAYYFTLNGTYPLIVARKKGNGAQEIYGTGLGRYGVKMDKFRLLESNDLSYIQFKGGYTSKREHGVKVHYDLGYYGSKARLAAKPNGKGYAGTIPIRICTTGHPCYDKNFTFDIIPF